MGSSTTTRMRGVQSMIRQQHEMDLRDYVMREAPLRGVPSLADEFRVSVSTVYRWIDKLGIPRGRCFAMVAPVGEYAATGTDG